MIGSQEKKVASEGVGPNEEPAMRAEATEVRRMA